MEFGFTKKGWTAVDGPQGGTVCAVSVRTLVPAGERPRVLAVAEEAVGADDDGTAGMRAVADKADQRLPLLMVLPRPQYRLRVMPEPAVPARDMLASLRWSIATEDGDMPEDLTVGWMQIPTAEHLPTRPPQLYAVVTSSPWLDTQLLIWRTAGLKPKVVDIRETALRNIAGALEHDGEGLLLVSADATGVGMVFTHRGSLYLDRHIDLPMGELEVLDDAGRARHFERVAVQILRSIDVVARNFPFMPVGRVVLAPSPRELGLADYLARQLPLPVQPLDLGQVFDLQDVPALAASPALQARCLVALGSTLRTARALPARSAAA